MPKKKEYPPSSRRSQRLTADPTSDPTKQPEEQLNDTDSEGSQAESSHSNDSTVEQDALVNDPNNDPDNDLDLALPSIEAHNESSEEFASAETSRSASPEPTLDETLAEMTDQQNLADENARLRNEIKELQKLRLENEALRSTVQQRPASPAPPHETAVRRANDDNHTRREPTPANSAYGGTAFVPTGIAARPSFKPYGNSQESPNTEFDKRARSSGLDAGKFKGDKSEFPKWITKLADKLDIDDPTFKKERYRMAVVYNSTEGLPQDILQDRYDSRDNPFSCAAEMVQILATAYYDVNQASNARKELANMMYDASPKTDILLYMSKIDSLADKAKIAVSERKEILLEHIPPFINPQLVIESRDPTMTYETFKTRVAAAAYAYQTSWELRQKKRQEKSNDQGPKDKERSNRPKNNDSNRHDNRRSNDKKSKYDKPATVLSAGRALTLDEKKVHWENETCFICGRKGHRGTDCPDQDKVPSIKALKAKKKEDPPAEDMSSTDESGKE